MNNTAIDIVKKTVDNMSNSKAKEMLSLSMQTDETIDDYLLSIRAGIVVASIPLESNDDNDTSKSIALTAVTNDDSRSMNEASLEEDVQTAINFIDKNYISGEVKWVE